MNGPAFSHVSFAFFLDDGLWDFQTYFAVDTSAFVSVFIKGLFGVTLHGDDARSLRI
jgi:hypothetical protein